jgi:hypothetical protein
MINRYEGSKCREDYRPFSFTSLTQDVVGKKLVIFNFGCNTEVHLVVGCSEPNTERYLAGDPTIVILGLGHRISTQDLFDDYMILDPVFGKIPAGELKTDAEITVLRKTKDSQRQEVANSERA